MPRFRLKRRRGLAAGEPRESGSRARSRPPRVRIPEALYEQLDESVAVYTREARCLYVNPTTERMFGKARGEVVGHLLWDLFPEAKGNIFHQTFERVARTGAPERFDHFYSPWQRWFSNRIFRADDCVWVIATDTTEWRHAQDAALSKSRKLSLLEKVSTAVLEAKLDLQAVLNAIASAVIGELSDSCVIYLLSEDGDRLDARVVRHVDPAAAEAIRRMTSAHPQAPGEGLLGKVVQRAQAIRVPVVDLDAMKAATKPEYRAFLDRYPFHSYLTVPLRIAGVAIGALGVVRQSPANPFSAQDEWVLQEVADRTSLSVHNARLFESEQRAGDRLRLLAEVSQTFSETKLDLQEALDAVCKEVALRISDTCSIELVSRTTGRLERVATHPPGREPAEVEDAPPLEELVVPLRVAAERVGTITISRAASAPYTPEDRRLLQELADRGALALSRAQRYQELQTERQLLAAVIEQMPSALAIVEAPSGKLLASNAQNKAIFRHDAAPISEIDDFGTYKGYHPNGREMGPRDWPLARSLLQGERIQGEEIHIVRGDGLSAFIRVNSAPVRDESGATIAGVVTYDDVTQHKEMLEAVRRGREQLRIVTDALPVLIAYVGADLRYRFVNGTYERWFGYAAGEVTGKRLQEVLGDAAFEAIRPYVEAALEGRPVNFESSVPYQEGGTRFVRGSYIPHRDADGEIDGYIGLVADITEEKAAREEREALLRLERQARERVSVLAHASQVLAGSLEYETTLRNVIGLAMPLLGDFGFFDVRESGEQVRRIAYAHRDPRRQGILDQTSWARSERADINLCALSSSQAGIHTGIDATWLRNIAVSPEHLALMEALAFSSMITVPLSYQERTLGALTLFYGDSGRSHSEADVQLAQELARRAAAAVENARLFKETQEAISIRDDFLSVAGHELRTPLTALELQLASVVRMLREARDLEVISPRAEKAARSLRRFSALVNELLDISRISAGRLTLERSTFDLAEVAREVLDRASEELARAGCVPEFESTGPTVGTWDRLRVEQVLTNLLSNAMKYGKGAPIRVRVEPDGVVARLSVQDFGIGISIEDQKRIFERFERAVSSRHFGGLGLGLWFSRQLIEAHGGTIRVESAPERGAQFFVELPLHDSRN